MDSLMAVPLEYGENYLDLRYVPDGFFSGAAVSFLSLLILIFLIRRLIKGMLR